MMRQSFVIASNILPMPRMGREPSAPFRELKVGQSFFIERSRPKRIPISYWVRATGYKLISRRTVEGGVEGFRVWRVQ
jgi:hypothetical protein